MRKPVSHLFGTAVGAALAWAVSALAVAGTYNSVISIGDPMPAFENLPSVAGERVSSSDLDEDVIVLISMSNACPFSSGAERDIIALTERFKDQSVRVVGVALNSYAEDDLPAMKKRAQKEGFNFTYVRDASQALGRQLGATVTPEFFVFDQDRQLIYTGLIHNSPAMKYGDDDPTYMKGEPTEFYVRNAIENTLAGKTVAVTETAPYGCTVEYINAE